jgi:hypothetical protein
MPELVPYLAGSISALLAATSNVIKLRKYRSREVEQVYQRNNHRLFLSNGENISNGICLSSNVGGAITSDDDEESIDGTS